MQFEKFINPKPHTEMSADGKYYDIQYQKTEAEMPALRYDSYVGSNPCPGWHAPVNRRPDEIEVEVKKWFTKGVVALVILYCLVVVAVVALKVLAMVWMMK